MSEYAAIEGHRLPTPRTQSAADEMVIMVCVGTNPSSQRLIRRAYNMAHAFGGRLCALHVTQPSSAPGYEVTLQDNLALARSFGAEVVLTQGSDLAGTIAKAAQSYGATMIVMGESARSRWDELRLGSVVRQVLSAAPGIDLYIVNSEASSYSSSASSSRRSLPQ